MHQTSVEREDEVEVGERPDRSERDRYPWRAAAWVLALAGPLALTMVMGTIDDPFAVIPGAWLLTVPALAALLGGRRPAVLATVLAGMALTWHLPPRSELGLSGTAAVGLAGFLACAAAIIGLVALLDDARHRSQQAARAIERIEQTTFALSHLGSMGVMEGRGETIVEANDAFLEMLGYDRNDLEAGRLTWPGLSAPGWEDVDAKAMAELVGDGRTGPYEKAYTRADGSELPVLLAASLLSRRPFRWAAFVADLGDLHAMQRQLMDHAEQSLDLARRIAAAPSVEELADVAADGVASTLSGRFSYFGALQGDQLLVRFHPAIDRDLAARFAVEPVDASGAGARAVRTGHTQRAGSIAEIHDRFPLFAEELERIGVSQLLVMPVRGNGGMVLGFVGVGWDDHHEVDVATEARLALVAELCGLTLQRALLFEWEHDVSATLQYALLGEMEEPKGLAVASRYLPATQGVQIGGDLVDVVDLHDGRAAVVVGDVVGHGLQAAATMGQLRIAVRVLARTASGPAELLDALAPFLEDVAEVRFSTLAVAFVDGGAQTLTYAAAGHPPAILVDEGRTRLLDGAQNTLLGVRGVDHAEVVVPWRAGSTLVSYTDGLVERRGVPVTEDIERLRLVVDEVASRGVDVVADELLERLRPQRFDDTALLVVRAEG